MSSGDDEDYSIFTKGFFNYKHLFIYEDNEDYDDYFEYNILIDYLKFIIEYKDYGEVKKIPNINDLSIEEIKDKYFNTFVKRNDFDLVYYNNSDDYLYVKFIVNKKNYLGILQLINKEEEDDEEEDDDELEDYKYDEYLKITIKPENKLQNYYKELQIKELESYKEDIINEINSNINEIKTFEFKCFNIITFNQIKKIFKKLDYNIDKDNNDELFLTKIEQKSINSYNKTLLLNYVKSNYYTIYKITITSQPLAAKHIQPMRRLAPLEKPTIAPSRLTPSRLTPLEKPTIAPSRLAPLNRSTLTSGNNKLDKKPLDSKKGGRNIKRQLKRY